MSRRPYVVVVGSHIQGIFIRVTRLPQPDETVIGLDYREALDGGKGSHVAIALSRLGIPTYFVGCVGQDRFGEVGIRWMQDAGVDLTYLKRSPQSPTGAGFVILDPHGTSLIISIMGANAELSEADLDQAEPLIAGAAAVVSNFEIRPPVALYAMQLAKRHGALAVLNPSPAEAMPPGSLSVVDILVCNRGEAQRLLGLSHEAEPELPALLRICQQQLGPRWVIVTLGERGAIVLEDDGVHHVPTVPVQVVDSPGAGDAFLAGLVAGLLRGLSFQQAIRMGCIAGAYAVTIPESIPSFPTLESLREFARSKSVEETLLQHLEQWSQSSAWGKGIHAGKPWAGV